MNEELYLELQNAQLNRAQNLLDELNEKIKNSQSVATAIQIYVINMSALLEDIKNSQELMSTNTSDKPKLR